MIAVHRTMKQLIILAVWCLVVFLIGVGVRMLFFAPTPEKAPTCSDGMKNQDEEGVDCGGVCRACTSVGNLSIRDTTVLPQGNAGYRVAFFAKNSNPDIGYNKVTFLLTFLDAQNQPFWYERYTDFINVFQERVFVTPVYQIAQTIGSVAVTVEGLLAGKNAGVPAKELIIENQTVALSADGASVTLSGTAFNDSNSLIRESALIAGSTDTQGIFTQAGSTVITALEPFKRRSFQISFPMSQNVDLSRVFVYSYSNFLISSELQ